jgi:hypothetical protein
VRRASYACCISDIVRDSPAKAAKGGPKNATARRQGGSRRRARDVAIVLYEGFAPFELREVCEVFGDDRWGARGDPWYRLFICGVDSAPVTADTGFQILVPDGLEILSKVDTIIVPPTPRPPDPPSYRGRDDRVQGVATGA